MSTFGRVVLYVVAGVLTFGLMWSHDKGIRDAQTWSRVETVVEEPGGAFLVVYDWKVLWKPITIAERLPDIREVKIDVSDWLSRRLGFSGVPYRRVIWTSGTKHEVPEATTIETFTY